MYSGCTDSGKPSGRNTLHKCFRKACEYSTGRRYTGLPVMISTTTSFSSKLSPYSVAQQFDFIGISFMCYNGYSLLLCHFLLRIVNFDWLKNSDEFAKQIAVENGERERERQG
jgi:hypothetical protein